MTIDATMTTDAFSPDNLIAGDKPSAKAVPIVLTDGEVVVRGTVLGRVTANGKYLVSLNAAVDGSEVARAIAAEPKSPSGADSEILAYVEGVFNQDELVFGAGQTVDNTKADLMDKNIYIVDPVTATPA